MNYQRIQFEEDAVAAIGTSCTRVDCTLDIRHFGPHRVQAAPLPQVMGIAETLTNEQILAGLEARRMPGYRAAVASLDAVRESRRG